MTKNIPPKDNAKNTNTLIPPYSSNSSFFSTVFPARKHKIHVGYLIRFQSTYIQLCQTAATSEHRTHIGCYNILWSFPQQNRQLCIFPQCIFLILHKVDKNCVLDFTINAYHNKRILTIERSHSVSHAIEDAFSNGHSEIRMEREGKEYQLHVNRIESNGCVIGAVVLAFDITEVAYAERNRREFTANVSHELKTPLQSIMGSAELMENGLVKEEDIPRFVGHIRTEAERLVALIEDIIRLSRLDEGSEMPFENVDMYEVAIEVVAGLADTAATRNVKITVTGETVIIRGVRSLLAEVIFNLCDNSIKYNKDGGTVEVIVNRQESKAVVSVKDSGIGIPPEHQTRVFERFYRVDKSRSKESGGTGLGLSIVKHAVQYLNGQIDLQSRPGEGTVIQIFFQENKNDEM